MSQSDDAWAPAQPLPGGNLSGVLRRGAVVDRATGRWSPAVHALLQHLAARGFAGAPRLHGVVAGRERLSFIEGTTDDDAVLIDDGALVQLARLIRDFHDATCDFVAPPGAAWQVVGPPPHEVVCHNDIAPYNLVCRDGMPHALIDFDVAGPGPRAWDIAYALYRCVPLDPHEATRVACELPMAARRVARFCAAYGIAADDALLQLVEQRVHALCLHLIRQALAGVPAYRQMLADGHLLGYQHALALLQRRRAPLLALLAAQSPVARHS
jgi:hypothetical protein